MGSFQNHVPVQQPQPQQQQQVFNQNFQSANANQPILNQQQQQSPVIKNYAHSQNNTSSSAHMDAFSQPAASSQMSNFLHQGVVSPNQEQFGTFENQMTINHMFVDQQNVTNFQQSSSNEQNMLYPNQENHSLDWSSSQNMSQMTPRIDPLREMDFTQSPNQSVLSANDALTSTAKSPLLSSTSTFQQQNHQFGSQASQNHMVQNILANPHPTAGQVETQKVVPRNNEYLQQQQQRPSPAQASTAPETSQINQQNQNKFVQKSSSNNGSVTVAAQMPPKPAATNTINTNNNNNTSQSQQQQHTTNNVVNNPVVPRTNMLEALRNSSTLIQSTSNDVASQKQPTTNNVAGKPAISKASVPIEEIAKLPLKNAVIKLDKITVEDQSLMTTDLKSFIQKDPQKAAKYGVAGPNNETIFSKMKEDDARLPYKRKLPMNNVRPEDVGKL